jgi:hypothetical protein
LKKIIYLKKKKMAFLPDDMSSDEEAEVDVDRYTRSLKEFQSQSLNQAFEAIVDIRGIFQFVQFATDTLDPVVFLQTVSLDLLLNMMIGSVVLWSFNQTLLKQLQCIKHMFEYIALESERNAAPNLLVGILDRALVFMRAYRSTTVSDWDPVRCHRFKLDFANQLQTYIYTRRGSFRRRELFPLINQLIDFTQN